MVSLEHLLDWQSLGFEIAAKIDNARTAWEQIQREKPDVIITDIRMPGLSGLDLLSRIHETALPIEVVLVSAFADFTYAQEAIRKGAFEYLLKPVRRDKLTACIQLLSQKLAKRSAQRDRENAAVRRDILARCASPREAFEAISGQSVQAEVAVVHCSTKLDSLLCAAPLDPAWLRIALSSSEAIYLCAGAHEQTAERLRQFCREQGLSGGFGLVHDPQARTPLDSLLYLARNALLTARFIGAAGLVTAPDNAGSAPEMELFKAMQYNQRAIVLSSLDSLRRETEAGHVLLDKLFALMQHLDSFWRMTLDGSPLFPAEWNQSTDLMRDYPSCGALFDYLTAALSDDPEEALLTPVLREIEERFACNRTLADLGQGLGVSQAHLSQLIRRRTGKTYSELVQEKRMEKAKELLAYSEKAVMDIAIEVGYSDQFYFSKLFKRLWGMSPGTWRKQVRSGNEITKSEIK